MRKQDRIKNEQQSRPQDSAQNERQPERQDREQVRGKASEQLPSRPERQPGKLPLPD